MIKITIDLIPYGIEEKKKTVGQFQVMNIGYDEKTGKYMYGYDGYYFHDPSSSHEEKGSFLHDRKEAIVNLCYRFFQKIRITSEEEIYQILELQKAYDEDRLSPDIKKAIDNAREYRKNHPKEDK